MPPPDPAPAGPDEGDLPAPIARSEPRAQQTFGKAHDSASHTRSHEGDEAYAHRVAYAALKHTYEKVGDHWEPKEHAGPSDPQAERTGPGQQRETYGGVDGNASKKHLLDLARALGVKGRSTMDKAELARAIDRANQKANAAAREG